MEYLQLIILGAIQAITEFLPISSDGHLLVGAALLRQFGGKQVSTGDLVVNIFLHFGTLLAILWVYWTKLWRLLGTDRRVIGLLVAGTLPAVVIALPIEELCPDILESVLVAGLMLPVTGAVVLWGMRIPPGTQDYTQLTYFQAVTIGVAQAVAILPGISRSGMTIVSCLALGLSRESAATFSFLLAVPAVAGAQVLAIIKLLKHPEADLAVGPLLAGVLVSFVGGVICLRLLQRWLNAGRLWPFGYWCIALGAVVVAWQLGWFGGTPS